MTGICTRCGLNCPIEPNDLLGQVHESFGDGDDAIVKKNAIHTAVVYIIATIINRIGPLEQVI